MKVSEKSHEIANKFCEYAETHNKTLIEKYTLEELKQARVQNTKDNYREFYKAIEDRIKELEEIKAERNRKREKWLDRLIGFISGIVVTLVAAYLKGCLRLEAK